MSRNQKIHNLQSLNFLYNGNCKVGILGGSFNPAHIGHYNISIQAIKAFSFDYVIWLIANQNPHKTIYKNDIFTRSSLALEQATHPRIIVSSAEHDLKTYYSYDTLKALVQRFPNISFTWLMGIDNLPNFHKWYRYEDIIYLCPIIVFDRPMQSRQINNSLFTIKFKPFLAKTQTPHIIIHRNILYHISSSQM